MDISRDTITRASKGDQEAFEEIYRLFSGYVYTLSFRITNNVEDAQEVTQDVFVRMYRNLGRFAFRSAFKTWIYRITVNTAINLYNRKRKERDRRVYLPEEMDIDTVAVAVEKVPLENDDNETLVRRMLEILTPEQRACVALTDIEGYKYHEVSRILGINIGTVKSRLKRAREKLISRFGKGGSIYEMQGCKEQDNTRVYR